MQIALKIVFTTCLGTFLCTIHSFDWTVYVQKYPEAPLPKKEWGHAFWHYLYMGYFEEKSTELEPIPDSNFDWDYYTQFNKLNLSNKNDALQHYQQEGVLRNLPYCAPHTIIIILHLYNLEFTDELVNQINFFIRQNPHNMFYLKICIPVDKNFDLFFNNTGFLQAAQKTAGLCQQPCSCTDDFSLLTHDTLQKESKLLASYLTYNINIPKEKIEIIFAPNRGRDIGGFFLSLDKIFKQDIKHDYIVKIHSKKSPTAPSLWRRLLTSFLNIPIHPLLARYDCIYANKIAFQFDPQCFHHEDTEYCNGILNYKDMSRLLQYFNLPIHNFNFCGGTMFLVSHIFTDFLKQYDMLELYGMLNDEHAFAAESNRPSISTVELRTSCDWLST